jgi:cytidine deaminase
LRASSIFATVGSELSHFDRALINQAEELLAARGDGENHTVAAAARASDGTVVVGMNVYHFNSGTCAELVVLGRAVTEGVGDLATIVGVGDLERGVLSPCGRCRQVLLDYHPAIRAIISADGVLRVVPMAELLPWDYRC